MSKTKIKLVESLRPNRAVVSPAISYLSTSNWSNNCQKLSTFKSKIDVPNDHVISLLKYKGDCNLNSI